MATKKQPGLANLIRLSQVKFYPKTYKGAKLKVRGKGYVGEFLQESVDLVGDVATHHIGNSKPASLAAIPSETEPGDINLIPTMQKHADYLHLDWSDDGRKVTTHMAKLLAIKQIIIPPATNLFIEVYPDNHPEHGPVIGLKMVGPVFEPVKAKKKKEEGTESTGKPSNAGTGPSTGNGSTSTQNSSTSAGGNTTETTTGSTSQG